MLRHISMKMVLNSVLALSALTSVSSMAEPRIMPLFRGVVPRKIHAMSTESTAVAWGQTANLRYYGGPVLSQVNIISVFWGPNVDPNVTSQIGGFYESFVTSPVMDMLTEYNTNIPAEGGHPSSNQMIQRGTFYGNVTITPKHTGREISDEDIHDELQAQIDAGVLPKPDDNTLVMIHFPPGVNISLTMGGQTAKSCQEFCAYHNAYVAPNSQVVAYGVMPDFAGGSCSFGCGSSTPFNNFCSGASHEIVEAVTDPQIGMVTGDNLAFPAAWYDPDFNGEIGDICAAAPTATISSQKGIAYTVQTEWSNAQKACVAGPASPATH